MLKRVSSFFLITLFFTACIHHAVKEPITTKFSKVDNNQNGKISLNEYIAYAEKKEQIYTDISLNSNFEVCDKNRDGKITIDELTLVDKVVPRIYGEVDVSNPKYFCFINKKQFSFFDKNTDSVITKDELKSQRFSSLFGIRCDLNKDKRLDKKEATSNACGYPNDEFIAHDLNHDGFLTMKELKYLNKKNRFLFYDKNGDGNLDENEFRSVLFFGNTLK